MNERTQICRTIEVEIFGDGRSRGSRVRTERPRMLEMSVQDFLAVILPGKKVESAGRSQLLKLGYRPQSTSLFFQTVHECFKNHYALTLRPEVLMHQIAHEVAVTVKQNPEAYRYLFTIAPEKRRIDVQHHGLELGNPQSPWYEAISFFEPALKEVVPPGIMEHLLLPFSTATVESRVASLITFMDAASPFFDYHTHTLCGIPEVRLAGTPEDYQYLVQAASQLAEVFRPHLGRYFDHLLPVLAKLAKQAAGAPIDQHFWSSIYKFESHSGTDAFNGWISAFVNYIQTAEIRGSKYQVAAKGELVAKPTDLYDWTDMEGGWGIKGLDFGSVPSHICAVPFVWHYYEEEKKMLFAGGELSVEVQDSSLVPGLSYAVLHDE